MELPLVSVILPTYNRAEYLPDAIESIVNQNYKPIELIIIDDCSTDETQRIIRGYVESFEHITFSRNKTNKERAFSRNAAIALSRGRYIALQESDDISIVNRIQRQVAYMEGHPECGVVGGFIEHMDEQGNSLPYGWHPPHGYLSGPVNRQLMLRCLTCVATPTLFFRRECFNVAGFNTSYIPAEDYQLLCMLSRTFEIHNLPNPPVVRYRNHDAQSDQYVQQFNKKRAYQEELEYERQQCTSLL